MEINILPPDVYNKISAGEVVEKPASIVKELVENSIDAGATKIEISITDGGKQNITISDNGCGIDKNNLSKAFLPHATSKIKDVEDLYKIASLGFRGEALASIGAVSKVEITSRVKQEKTGWSIRNEGGIISEIIQKGAQEGTFISVNELFFNTPARQKFLKNSKKEESDITSFVTRLILANPTIAFKYYADDKLIYSSSGLGLKDAVFCVYGKEVLDELLPIEVSSPTFKLDGFIGKTTFFKSNRTYQTVMVNGRWVADSIINVACNQCYESYMMKRCFPFYILNLTVPNESVDVNVHPNKLEVRFQDNKAIFSFVYNAVTNRIYDHLMQRDELSQEKATFSSTLQLASDLLPQENKPEDNYAHSSSTPASILHEVEIDKFVPNENTFLPPKEEAEFKIEARPVATQENLVSSLTTQNDETLALNLIGKAFNTFVIVEMDDNLYFIDQHAAHERLLYDKFVAQIKDNAVSSQILLLPYNITVNSIEEQFLLDNLEMLNSLGFDIESFGPLTFKISAIPSILPNLNIQDFFTSFLHELNNFAGLKSVDLVKDYLAETACKHAVKGGDDLTKNELEYLIKYLSEGNVTKQCPHGRPFLMKFSHREIEKWFKRIV